MNLPLIVLAGAGAVYRYGPSLGARYFGRPFYLIKPSPRRYCELALELAMRYGIDAASMTAHKGQLVARAKMPRAHSMAEAHEIADALLKAAGGKRSGVIDSAPAPIPTGVPKVERKENTVLVTLPGFSASDYANATSKSIIRELESGAKSVVIDLRAAHDGELAEMLAAVSPLLPDGVAFSYRDNTNDLTPVSLFYGQVDDGEYQAVIDGKQKYTVPVALLIGEHTRGTGEAVALAFRGLVDTRTFGTPTYGLTCWNAVFPMPDGTSFVLTTNTILARTGAEFCGEPIEPDSPTADPVTDALTWASLHG
ncbi:hypothetical protein FRX94_07185 [Corynebacterium canis]|uniref:Tail specific protease domain-containing protein n=1 Tax=Corynebacterium canis TaxID=679663 RepID=A0A5C5UE99_9CORY|nr:S41 family peptidase [Corynebacterium canis]TWT25041.1 hypothetical protein FRX94_07185 [Corynebacterium canis]WJY76077.1 Peptidase family S41 [Corynebacterium canis]